MRTSILLAIATAALAISAACASSEEQPPPATEPPPSAVLDADAPDTAAPDADVPDTSLPRCSTAGWCVTPFPDEDLDFRDIWPFEDRAFAIARSRTEGVKVLEWEKSADAWHYIDDRTQNDFGIGTFAGRIYAPNADEVYFTVGPAFVYHGKRPVAPATTWTWTRYKLPDNVAGHPADHDHGNPYYTAARGPQTTLGVWGTGDDDVYAYYSNAIFRRDPEDGTWSAVYVAGDAEAATEHIFFAAASGTGPDDLWFVGGRDRAPTSCPLVVRKTGEGWTRIADGIVRGRSCALRPDTMRIGDVGGGWLTEIHPVSATEYIALQDAMTSFGTLESVKLTRILPADGGYSAEQSVVPVRLAQNAAVKLMSSLWRVNDENWFTSWGLVLHGTDDGKYTVSTISRDGAPVDAPLHRIRGTSNQDLWAIGARYAYHKTTP